MKNARTLLLTAISLTAIAVAMYLANTSDDFEVSIRRPVIQIAATPVQPESPKAVSISAADSTSAADANASHANSNSAQARAAFVLDTAQSAEARREVLYALSEMGEAAISPLRDIAAASFDSNIQSPHSADRGRVKLERTLRISAIEGLDKLSHSNPRAIFEALTQVAEKQNDSALRFLAQTGLAGIQQGKPGKIARLMDKMLSARDR